RKQPLPRTRQGGKESKTGIGELRGVSRGSVRSSPQRESFQIVGRLPNLAGGHLGTCRSKVAKSPPPPLAIFDSLAFPRPAAGSKVAKLTHKGVAIFRMTPPGADLQRHGRVEGCQPAQTDMAIFNAGARALMQQIGPWQIKVGAQALRVAGFTPPSGARPSAAGSPAA